MELYLILILWQQDVLSVYERTAIRVRRRQVVKHHNHHVEEYDECDGDLEPRVHGDVKEKRLESILKQTRLCEKDLRRQRNGYGKLRKVDSYLWSSYCLLRFLLAQFLERCVIVALILGEECSQVASVILRAEQRGVIVP